MTTESGGKGESRDAQGTGGDDGRFHAEGSVSGRRRWLVPTLTILIPVILFVATLAFLVLRGERHPGCRHDHPASRVQQWWEKARTHEIDVPGMRYLSYDEEARCIRVGIDDPRAQVHLHRRFQRLKVPADVVVYERVGDGEARDSARPGGERAGGRGPG